MILNNSGLWGDLRWVVIGFDVYFRGYIPLKGLVVLIVRKSSWKEPGEYRAAGDLRSCNVFLRVFDLEPYNGMNN